jgi:hypothetical protein
MVKAGFGYGSDYHLLRYLGYHRDHLNEQILSCIDGSRAVLWMDQPFAQTKPNITRQWLGLQFLPQKPDLQQAWKQFWPARNGIHNWDAVAWIWAEHGCELLLVEAKAHTGELKSSCKASTQQSRQLITSSLDSVKAALGVALDRNWQKGYYQYCNRIAALHFLMEHGIPAHLLFIYFYGDYPGHGGNCPQSSDDWSMALAIQKEHIGLPQEHPLSGRIHALFLPATGDR